MLCPIGQSNEKPPLQALAKWWEYVTIPNIMFTTYFAYYQERITFREISFKPRQGGVNSINIPRIIKIGWKAVGDFRKLKREM